MCVCVCVFEGHRNCEFDIAVDCSVFLRLGVFGVTVIGGGVCVCVCVEIMLPIE